MQGKTVENAVYQPTDMSSSEEGYVATTRARSGTRIYIVEEETQDVNKPKCTDYNDEWKVNGELVAKALEKRRAKLTATELDNLPTPS